MRTEFHDTCSPPTGLLTITGELDLATGVQLETAIQTLAARGCRHIELDLDGVTFIDAYSLGILDREQRRLHSVDADLVVAVASARCGSITEVAGYPALRPLGRGPSAVGPSTPTTSLTRVAG